MHTISTIPIHTSNTQMAKLTLLALVFAALVAFATAHTTIVTTVVEDENPFGRQSQMCRQQLQQQRLDICQRYLQQGQSPYDDELNRQQGQQYLQQQCCQQLQNVDRQCQCEAVKQVFEISRQQIQGQQQGQFGSPQQLEQQLEQKAQNLPQQCRLQIRQQKCQIKNDVGGSQQCRRRIQGQRFNHCRRFIDLARILDGFPWGAAGSYEMAEAKQQIVQCCNNELENVQSECHCNAMEELHRQAREIQDEVSGQKPDPYIISDQPIRDEPWISKSLELIRNRCNLQVQQCQNPSPMF